MNHLYRISDYTPAERELESYVRVQGKLSHHLDRLLDEDYVRMQEIIKKNFKVTVPSYAIKSAGDIVRLDGTVLDAVMTKEKGALSKQDPLHDDLHKWFLISQIRMELMSRFPGRHFSISDDSAIDLGAKASIVLSYIPIGETKANSELQVKKGDNCDNLLGTPFYITEEERIKLEEWVAETGATEELYKVNPLKMNDSNLIMIYYASMSTLAKLILEWRGGINDLIMARYNPPNQLDLFPKEVYTRTH